MALVVPLKLWRPQAAFVRDVASLPYDVLSREEAVARAAGIPLSFLHVEKSEIDLPAGIEMTDERVFQTAGRNLQRLMDDGVLMHDDESCFYIYSQQMGEFVQYGITAGVAIADYEAGRIKRHEQTRTAKEIERTRHNVAVRAQTGLVFIFYRSMPAVDKMVSAVVADSPLYDFIADDGIAHRVWKVNSPQDIGFLKEQFVGIDTLYIADGHHRAAAAAAVWRMRKRSPAERGDEPYNFMLATLFPDRQLRILDYNRVVRDLNGLAGDELLSKIKEKFDIEPDFYERKPSKMHTFGMYLKNRWFKLTAKAQAVTSDDPVCALDVSILQDHLLGPVLGIRDQRSDERIDFVGGIRGMEALEKMVYSGDYAAAFSLYPTTLSQLMDVADAGSMMPPKSTWFEPKLRSGIFVHRID